MKEESVKPNVFIVGVPKSAKVSLRYWLSQHPDVYACMHDIDFFSIDTAGKQDRVNSLEKYLSYFKEGNGKKIILDQTTRSAVSRKAHKLIKEFNPQAKIIICIRNPAEQMFSWHHTLRKIGLETEPNFYKALIREKERKKKDKSGLIRDYFYREFADYYPQVKRYVDTFGRKNVKVMLFDDLGKKGDEQKKKKVYYDLLEQRRKNEQNDVAIVRVEQLYPFPHEEMDKVIEQYSHVKDFVWCQEEPKNQGAWYSTQHRMRRAVKQINEKIYLRYAGRKSSAAPAAGYISVHVEEQNALVNKAFEVKKII